MAGRIVPFEPGSRKSVKFDQEMASAGCMDVSRKPFPGMQKVTIQHILDGSRSNTSGAVGWSSGQAMIPDD